MKCVVWRVQVGAGHRGYHRGRACHLVLHVPDRLPGLQGKYSHDTRVYCRSTESSSLSSSLCLVTRLAQHVFFFLFSSFSPLTAMLEVTPISSIFYYIPLYILSITYTHIRECNVRYLRSMPGSACAACRSDCTTIARCRSWCRWPSSSPSSCRSSSSWSVYCLTIQTQCYGKQIDLTNFLWDAICRFLGNNLISVVWYTKRIKVVNVRNIM